MDTPDFFEIFGIPVRLKLDPSALKPKYLQLSREFHPDFHTGADENIQAEKLQRSAQLNKAWKTFQDPDATIRYVLMSKGLMEEEEKYELPPEFLMEMLEINDQLMDGAGSATTTDRITGLQREIYAPVREIIEQYDPQLHGREELLKVKEYYYKKKYLDRVLLAAGSLP